MADGPSEDGGEEAVAHPRQVEAGVRLNEQVGHDEVVRQAGERVLAHACEGEVTAATGRRGWVSGEKS